MILFQVKMFAMFCYFIYLQYVFSMHMLLG